VKIRSLALEMYRKEERTGDSVRLTRLLSESFSDVPRVAEFSQKDTEQLADLQEQQKKLGYEVELGTVFASRLSISHEGIEWHGTRWPFGAISRVRWGAVSRRVNGVPSGTEYTIGFGNKEWASVVNTSRAEVFEAVTSRLAEMAGLKIVVQMLRSLSRGEALRFGAAVVHDLGVQLPVRHVFSNAAPVFVPWSDITLSSANGYFRMTKKGAENVGVALSYQDEWNVHPLELALRRFFKTTEDRFSSVLEEKGRAA
jgi:hypothetical protein